jgi:peptidoglycan hydrolase-like protein with peptidoglycan-binding domain
VFEHFMGVGDDDDDVVHLQQRLIALGYLQGTATGTYGPLTEAAVKKYQKAKGLTQTGYVERVTRAALNAR